jgi:hypothetical protein
MATIEEETEIAVMTTGKTRRRVVIQPGPTEWSNTQEWASSEEEIFSLEPAEVRSPRDISEETGTSSMMMIARPSRRNLCVPDPTVGSNTQEWASSEEKIFSLEPAELRSPRDISEETGSSYTDRHGETCVPDPTVGSNTQEWASSEEIFSLEPAEVRSPRDIPEETGSSSMRTIARPSRRNLCARPHCRVKHARMGLF